MRSHGIKTAIGPAVFLLLAASVDAAVSDLSTLGQGLQASPAALINSQGLAQHDLSLRGSSYTGAGISLNGLNLRVPYSAHFNTELPWSGGHLSDPAVGYGPTSGSGYLVGTAAYLISPHPPSLQAESLIGTRDHYAAAIRGNHEGAGGFLAGEKARRIDYAANDYERSAGGVSLQRKTENWHIDLIGASQRKTFGAQGYYGIPATQEARQKTQDTLLLFSAMRGEMDDAFLRAGVAWRQFDDTYSGFVPGHDVRSRYSTATVEGRTMEIQQLALNWRADIEHEQVDGTVGSHDRTRGSVLLLPELRLERLTFKTGCNTVIQSDESAEALPIAGIDWSAGDNSVVYAGYSESTRQPDYQTLESNPLLREQRSQNSELGFRQLVSEAMDWHAALFHRRMEQASDWIGGTATDLGSLDTTGFETAIRYYPAGGLRLQIFYQWVHKDSSRKDGLYELDYPEHLLNLSAYWPFVDQMALEFSQTMRCQTDNSLRTGSDFGADASMSLHYDPRFAKNVRFSLRADNLWSSNFQIIPGLDPRPFSIASELTVGW